MKINEKFEPCNEECDFLSQNLTVILQGQRQKKQNKT